eukprot:CAMPEP_0203943888 /NCGR_PEP_ID=MMETSP0359-20131031/79763_1 /ASSEMBLY_ACC=CAM_ASM_000338 /TAXON_ID=268821 /ORGANISM="Scrippsiella Hangoei, Strain SHTV-5" /LENGTH=47 /DNA_ID= /DNA_START= /DNA_END= /DNA_ORIENTATION=
MTLDQLYRELEVLGRDATVRHIGTVLDRHLRNSVPELTFVKDLVSNF